MPLARAGGVGIYISTHCTNEGSGVDFSARGAAPRNPRLRRRPASGQFRRVPHPADKNPNTNGLRLVAEAFGTKLEDLSSMDGVRRWWRSAPTGFPPTNWGAFELIVAIAQNDDAAAAEADVTLPCRASTSRKARW